MSSPAASWALTMHATASRYCSRKIESPSADLNDRPRRLSVNQSGRGYDPVMAVGSIRSCVTFSIASPGALSWCPPFHECHPVAIPRAVGDALGARGSPRPHGREYSAPAGGVCSRPGIVATLPPRPACEQREEMVNFGPSVLSLALPPPLPVAPPPLGPAPAVAAPEGQIPFAIHVSLAPAWFDPAE